MVKLAEAADVVLLRAYLQLRDARAERKKQYDTLDEDDKGRQERIEGEILRRLNERGLDKMSATDVGTAYRSKRTSATVADWDAFFSHVMDTESYQLLERRANKKAVEEFQEVNDDLPPGVNYTVMHTVNFRRK